MRKKIVAFACAAMLTMSMSAMAFADQPATGTDNQGAQQGQTVDRPMSSDKTFYLDGDQELTPHKLSADGNTLTFDLIDVPFYKVSLGEGVELVSVGGGKEIYDRIPVSELVEGAPFQDMPGYMASGDTLTFNGPIEDYTISPAGAGTIILAQDVGDNRGIYEVTVTAPATIEIDDDNFDIYFSENFNLGVATPKGMFKADVKPFIEEIQANEKQTAALSKILVGSAKKAVFYDIAFKDANGNVVAVPEGNEIVATIALPEGFDKNARVYYFPEDGSAPVDMKADIDESGSVTTATFTTTHFSTYGVIQGDFVSDEAGKAATGKKSPKTGVDYAVVAGVTVAMAAAAAGVAVARRKEINE